MSAAVFWLIRLAGACLMTRHADRAAVACAGAAGPALLLAAISLRLIRVLLSR